MLFQYKQALQTYGVMNDKVGNVELLGNGAFGNKDDEEMVPNLNRKRWYLEKKKNLTCTDWRINKDISIYSAPIILNLLW